MPDLDRDVATYMATTSVSGPPVSQFVGPTPQAFMAYSVFEIFFSEVA